MKKNLTWILPGIALVLLLLFPVLINNSYFISIMITTLLYAYLASSWNIICGIAGQMGMGIGLYFSLGAYIVGALFTFNHMNPWLAMLAAGLIVGIISIFIGILTFPLSGTYYSLATVALLNILRIVFNENDYILGQKFGAGIGIRTPWLGGFANMQFIDKWIYYYIILALLIIALVICIMIDRSKSGYYYRAINTNQMAAASMGVNVLYYKLKAQLITAFMMAIGGGFFIMYTMYIEPVGMFSFDVALNILLMAVIGGRGTIFGPFVGAIILMPVYEILRFNFSTKVPGLPTIIFGVLLMLTMQFIPEGLLPSISKRMKIKKLSSQTVAEIKAGE